MQHLAGVAQKVERDYGAVVAGYKIIVPHVFNGAPFGLDLLVWRELANTLPTAFTIT